jgi:hypothetical protein
MVQGKGNMQQKTMWMIFDTYNSSLDDEWAMSFVRSCWSSSYALLHLSCEFFFWLTQIGFMNFLQGLVRQNNQYLLKHNFSSITKLDSMSNWIKEGYLT